VARKHEEQATMSDPSNLPTDRQPSSPTTGASRIEPRETGRSLRTDRGLTHIADTVVAKIAGRATREIEGVQAMGKGMARTLGAIRARVPGGGGAEGDVTQGVTVEVGERQTAIDIDIVTHYGMSIAEVTEAVRANVIDRIESMTGLEVTEVNITVDDLYLESEASGREGARVE